MYLERDEEKTTGQGHLVRVARVRDVEQVVDAPVNREVLVDGVARAGTAYRWTGGAYGEDGADFVVDAGGLLLSYAVTQPSGRWEVTLAEVTGPWPVPSSWPTPG